MSTVAPLTITGGRLVLPAGEPQTGGIRCEAGRIVALGEVTAQPGDTVIDAKGMLIAPGLVDLGVFAIDKAGRIAYAEVTEDLEDATKFPSPEKALAALSA